MEASTFWKLYNYRQRFYGDSPHYHVSNMVAVDLDVYTRSNVIKSRTLT